MLRLVSALCFLTLAACGADRADSFRQGLPSQNAVKLAVPGQGQALTAAGQRSDPLEGQKAEYYALTRGVSLGVNGATASVLTLVEKIVRNPPTSVQDQNVAIWGPHTDALSPVTWKLTVKRTAPNQHSYILEGKGKTEADSAFRGVLSGTHLSTGVDLGSGTFLIDFDAAQTLPEHGNEIGTAMIDYSRVSSTSEASVTATFVGVRDDASGQRVNATYKYVEQPGQGGSLDFTMNKNAIGGPAIEALSIRSRWTQSGTGRADVRGVGGDLTTPVTINECWDAGFLSRYFLTSFDPTKNYGQATACAFATAEYTSL